MDVEAAKKKLCDAVEKEDEATIQEVLLQSPKILDEVSFACSKDLLHIEIIHRKATTVVKVLDKHPRLARELDSKNSSPLHIAAAEGSLEIAKKLLSIAPETRWWRDCHDMNPVHIAAIHGSVDILWTLLEFDSFPAMERVRGGQTVLHLCVKHGQLEALKFLVDKLGELVYAKDDDGETVWSLAVKCNKLENIRNNIIKDNDKPTFKLKKNPLAKRYSDIEKVLKIWSKERIIDILPKLTDTTMVVVVLIATMAFQAAVSPPGGVWQDNTSSHKAGDAVMASTHPKIYKHFARANTTAFISSLIAIFLITTGQPAARPHFMFISLFAMWASLASIAVSYGASVKVISPNTETQSLVHIIMIVVMLGFIYAYNNTRQKYLSWKRKLRRGQDLTTDSRFARAFYWIFRRYDLVRIENSNSDFVSTFTQTSGFSPYRREQILPDSPIHQDLES